MYGEYEALCSITEEELHTQFAEPIQEMAASFLQKGYARPYEADSRKVVKVGVNFSSQTGTIQEWETQM